MEKRILLCFAVVLALTLVAGCAVALQNYDQISLGMSKAEVKSITGDPHRILEGETSGEGPFGAKAGKHEIWFYKGGALIFSGDKLVSKVRKVEAR